jgi:DNA-binding MarR family transcriptional regulator
MDTTPRTTSNQTAIEISSTDQLAATFESLIGEYMRWLRTQAPAGGPSTSRLRLLESLHCEGAQKMSALADALGVTPRNITALVDGLEEEGMVRRVAHPTDRRATLIELTGEAPNPVELMAAHRAAIDELFSCLTDDEKADYLALTQRLEERFRDARRQSPIIDN